MLHGIVDDYVYQVLLSCQIQNLLGETVTVSVASFPTCEKWRASDLRDFVEEHVRIRRSKLMAETRAGGNLQSSSVQGDVHAEWRI